MAWRGVGNVDSLLTQLQEFEESMTNLMLETILKMQTLTETRVFMLLEHPGTKFRRFCGHKELVGQYENGNLCKTDEGSAAEVRLDPDVELLMTRKRGKKRVRANANDTESECTPSKRAVSCTDNGDAFEDSSDPVGKKLYSQ